MSRQVPSQHPIPAAQAFPHLPQFSSSEYREMHCPAQQVSFHAHSVFRLPQVYLPYDRLPHLPSRHMFSYAGQANPQEPQFCGSRARSEQVPLQQVSSPRHAMPQAPQFSAEDRRS
jgi:hypothetical protein